MVASFTQKPSGTEIAKRAWNSTFSAIRVMPMLFLSAALGAVFAAVILAGLAYAAQPLAFFIVLGNVLAWSALGAPVAVAVHRFILLDESTPGLLSYAPHHTRAFFLWLFALQVAAEILNAIGTAQILLRLVTLVVIVIASVNLAMIFPAIATDVPCDHWQARLRQSWDRMQGHFWLFFRASIITFLPFLGVWVLIVAVAAIMGAIMRATGFSPLAGLIGLWVAVAIGVMMIFFVALGAAVASWMYLWTGDPQAQSEQTATSTVT